MDKILTSAIIMGVSLIVMGFLIGGRYIVAPMNKALGIFVVDRLTGRAVFCNVSTICDFGSLNQTK